MALLVFIISICLFALLLSLWAYRKTFFRRRRRKENIYDLPREISDDVKIRLHALIKDFDAVECEPVEILSHDGLRLFGRYYHVADGAPLHIQLHGYRSYAMRDFCGINSLSRTLGCNTLVVDQRAHGKSEGHTITFGIKERQDCLLWTEYAARRFGRETPIFLSGVSMGAATVLMATALPLPENVAGVIADCPYSSPRAIIRRVIGYMQLPVTLAYPLVVFAGMLFGNIFGLSRASAVEAVRLARCPILLIHGEDDTFVPCDMSREIQAARPDLIRLETFAGADHVMSYMTDVERYRKITAEFSAYCLEQFQKTVKEEDS